ncbi:MAG TPA: hypothetical protein VF509_05900 [Sphingobium sp.]
MPVPERADHARGRVVVVNGRLGICRYGTDVPDGDAIRPALNHWRRAAKHGKGQG